MWGGPQVPGLREEYLVLSVPGIRKENDGERRKGEKVARLGACKEGPTW